MTRHLRCQLIMGQAIPILCQLVLMMCHSLIHPYVLTLLHHVIGMYIADDATYTSGTRPRSETEVHAVRTRTTPGVYARPRMPPIRERIPSASVHRGTAYAAVSTPIVPPPSVASDVFDAVLSANASDSDDDYPAAGQNTRQPRSRRSVASSQASSHASHHSEAMQLASTLADALKEQLKQACERQQRLD